VGPQNAAGVPLHCRLSEPRTFAGPGAYDGLFPDDLYPTPAHIVPMPLAIIKRWAYLCRSRCGLRVGKKMGVTGIGILQDEYGTVAAGGVPTLQGLDIAGIPIGTDAYVKASLADTIRNKVASSYAAVDSLTRVQHRHLLHTYCCGAAQAQHLWQTVRPSLASEAIHTTDVLTDIATSRTLGTRGTVPTQSVHQSYLPQRYGGLGYRHSRDISGAAYLGGFAMAAYGDFNVASQYPPLAADIASPETSSLPSLRELGLVWAAEITRTPYALAIATAAAARSVCPIDGSPEEDADPSALLQQQDTAYEVRWKAEFVEGKEITEDRTTSALNIALLGRASDTVTHMRAIGTWSARDEFRYGNPAQCSSILGLWAAQGGTHFQRFFSRAHDSWRFQSFLQGVPEARERARFRGVLSAMASVPLRALPNRPERIYDNDAFQWYLNNRVQGPQPSVHGMALQRCSCTKGNGAALIEDGRHFRKCKKSNVMLQVHDRVRDSLILMCKAAGLTTRREPSEVLLDNPDERPGDLVIENWTVPKVQYSRHAIDVTCPLADSSWRGLPPAQRDKRSGSVGVAALAGEAAKSTNIGTVADRAHRGNTLTMTQRCHRHEVHFWPIGLEGDGVPTRGFSHFINNVCDAAKNLKDANRASFKSYFLSRISHTLHQTSARVALRRIAAERARIIGQDSSVDFGSGALPDLRHEPQTLLPGEASHRYI
jgi:hypothetical protein